jgi:hypothetical protein
VRIAGRTIEWQGWPDPDDVAWGSVLVSWLTTLGGGLLGVWVGVLAMGRLIWQSHCLGIAPSPACATVEAGLGLLAWTQAAAAGSLGLGVAIWIYEEVLA